MRAIILAAGRGSRMGKGTAERPKCLTPLAGKPLLRWQRAALCAAGIDRIAVVCGYRGEMLAGQEMTTFDNPRWSETNMVATLCCASEWLETYPCIISYSDIVYHPDHIRRLMQAEGAPAITYDRLWRELWTARFADPLADAETFRVGPDGNLVEIGRRASSLEEIEGQYMGLLKFTPEAWGQVSALLAALSQEQRDRLDMTSLLRHLIALGESVATVPVMGHWCEVDNEQDLYLYETLLNSEAPWSHDWR